MFKAKLLSLFSVLGIFFLTENLNLEQEQEVIPSIIKLEKKGGIIKLNDQEVFVEFFGYEDVPNKETVWTKKIKDGFEMLEYKSKKNNVTYQLKINRKNPLQPLLDVAVFSNVKINLRHSVIFKNISQNKKSQIITNLSNLKIDEILSKVNSFSISDKVGWLAFVSENNVLAVKINNEKIEITKDLMIFYKENFNCLQINETYQLHSSCNQYSILKNQTLFANLDDIIDFGYYLYFLSKPIFIITKKIQEKTKNIFLTLLLIFIIFGLIILPFSIESIKMQKTLDSMQPELNAINTISNLSFNQKNLMIKEIHNRYGYFQITHFLGQILLIVSLTIFQSVFGTIEFVNLIPNTQLINYSIILLVMLTIVIYNALLFKNNQIFITILFSIFFLGYPKLPLIGFVFLHWFNIFSFYIYSRVVKYYG
ncbi:hypothetical protein [Alphaproteobacteria bacterium endosymbiont of Tiliacea citrago]|uniref:hypothetical protein n=1 Tax=Alphaproteobacteria bacterium endosymbiont of Tiliacea citrago TaxID=3077944 RepID=UPI00313BD093